MTTTLDSPARTTDRNVAGFDHLPTPREMLDEHPLGAARARLVADSRREIARILDGKDWMDKTDEVDHDSIPEAP